jgi:hypothetical protein
MSTSLNENLPEVLKSVRTRPLFVMRLDVRKLLIIGATPASYRHIGVVPGSFPRMHSSPPGPKPIPDGH